ncbi:MAG: fluoride efflux transporter CrcB [Bacteroidota bacterium]
MSWLFVFLGGGLGSLARYGTAQLFPPVELSEGDFPWATLAANILACIVLGVGLALLSKNALSKPLQLFLLTGFCGGFSTFSTYAAEILLLGEEGNSGAALAYLALSIIGGIGALWLALVMVR